MFEILPSPPHLGAYRFTGTLTAADYERCIADIEARLARFARIGLYCDLRGFTGVTPAAIAHDLRYTLGKIGQFDRFARGAIVTDRHWLATVTGFAAKFFPETEIRSFGEDEVEAALAWAGAVDPQPPPDAAA
ncbi:SpoIIAA family protein [Pseudoxanthomonas kaohsiungensis]|uniref:STAS/SEC14 domain-containing protein n=1 Tax=Pseudoxanthomonas kaohsiungensis TaxID=283923 RepID=UPI0035B444D8